MIKICYIDVETGGTNPEINPVLQLSGKIEINGVAQETFNWFIRCPDNKVLEPSALEVNHLTEEQVRGPEFPTYKEVYTMFVEMLDKYVNRFDKRDKFFFCGYNAHFDDSFMRQFFIDNAEDERAKQYGNFYGSYFWTPVLDVMQLAVFYLILERANLDNFKLNTVYRFIFGDSKADSIKWHDALGDIEATEQIFKFLSLGCPKRERIDISLI